MREARKRGITLVETLVVVFVAGVLVLFLVPVILAARAAARGQSCIANLRTSTPSRSICSQNHVLWPSTGRSLG